ncbi:hypothetical protein ACLB2K_041427 [Fragaria x ananassa]
MAPTKMKGALNMGFQMAITIGILLTGLVNFGTARIKGGYGWRISLAVAAIPSMIMTVSAMFLPDAPNSMLERGQPGKARKMLQKIRGSDSVNDEFQDLVDATEVANKVENQWGNIMQQRYRPQRIICVFVPFFQQLTGINVIMFYAPVLFKTLGFGDEAALMSAVITGSVNEALVNNDAWTPTRQKSLDNYNDEVSSTKTPGRGRGDDAWKMTTGRSR